MTKWPAPIIRLYLGQVTPETLLSATDDLDARTKKRQVCEAHFFIGELALQHAAKDEAARLFRLVAEGCSAVGASLAIAELKTLGGQP